MASVVCYRRNTKTTEKCINSSAQSDSRIELKRFEFLMYFLWIIHDEQHEIDFNCISINLTLSPWTCYVKLFWLMCWDCDGNDMHTRWFHNEQVNYMLSVAFQSKVLILPVLTPFVDVISVFIRFHSYFYLKIVLRMTFITRADHTFYALWH